jgi:hypothetical protein
VSVRWLEYRTLADGRRIPSGKTNVIGHGRIAAFDAARYLTQNPEPWRRPRVIRTPTSQGIDARRTIIPDSIADTPRL